MRTILTIDREKIISATLFILPFAAPFLLLFSLYGAPFLVWVSLIPWLMFLFSERVSTKRKWYVSFLVGTLYGSLIVLPLYSLEGWWWTPENVFFWAHREILWNGLVTFLGLFGGGVAFFLFSIITLLLKERVSWIALTVLLPAAWVLIEIGREFALAGLTWAHVGYLVNEAEPIQLAHLGGVHSLGFMVLLVNISFTLSLLTYTQKVDQRMFLMRACVPFFILLFIYGTGAGLYAFSENTELGMTVAVVGSPYSTEESTGSAFFTEVIQKMENTLAETEIDVIVLPENIFPFLVIDKETNLPHGYEREGSIYNIFNNLADLSRQYADTSFVIGVHSSENGDRFNSLIALENGKVRDSYDKRMLLPFTEAVLPGVAGMDRYHINPLKRGSEEYIDTQHGRFGALICSEIASHFSAPIPKEARLILTGSNDSVLPHEQTGLYHNRMARVQAVTHRLPVLRSTKSGISAVIDARGDALTSQKIQRSVIILTTDL